MKTSRHMEHFLSPSAEDHLAVTRRHFFSASATGLGGVALAGLLGTSPAQGTTPSAVNLPPKAKRVIYLFQ